VTIKADSLSLLEQRPEVPTRKHRAMMGTINHLSFIHHRKKGIVNDLNATAIVNFYIIFCLKVLLSCRYQQDLPGTASLVRDERRTATLAQ
jgi:hypothetical protein